MDNEKIYLNIYDLNKHLIEQCAFIYFDSIEVRLRLKLENLAIIYGSKKVKDNNLYFRYYKIECYKLKNFNTFLDLIKSNTIKVTLMLRFAKSGKDFGKNKSKNIIFAINKFDVSSLFTLLYSYEN